MQVVRIFRGLTTAEGIGLLCLPAGCGGYLARASRTGKPFDAAFRRVCRILLVGSVLLVLALVLSPSFQQRSLNLVPGRGLLDSADPTVTVVNITGNVLVFVPLGLLAPGCARVLRRPWTVLTCSVVFSTLIETAQYTLRLGRTADITDVLLNVAGVMTGYACHRVLTNLPRATGGRESRDVKQP